MAGTRMVIHTDAPEDATAALVTLTGVDATANGYFVAESCTTDPPAIREWSNGNIRAGRAVAATAIVELDSQGRFCLFNSTSMHSAVDVRGFFMPGSPSDGALYQPITPTRTVDTRQWPFCTPEGSCTAVGPIPAGREIESELIAPDEAVATVANITVLRPNARGFLTADLCSAITPGVPPSNSNVNFLAGDVVANLAVPRSLSGIDGEQFCTYTGQAAMNELIDVQGFFVPAAAGGLSYNAGSPERLVDTRTCWTDAVTDVERCAQPNAAGTIIHMEAPDDAEAVVINITMTETSALGAFVSAGPCDVISAGMPEVSNVNGVIGSAVANTAIVPVDNDGMFCVYLSHPTHVIVDLMGTFEADGQRFLPFTARVHDSRAPG